MHDGRTLSLRSQNRVCFIVQFFLLEVIRISNLSNDLRRYSIAINWLDFGMDYTTILSLRLWVLGILMPLPFISSATLYDDLDLVDASPGSPLTPHEYTRLPEVKRQCSSFLSSGRNLEFNVDRANSLMLALSFSMGDWSQASGDAPLMPFDASDAPANASELPDPLRLATFEIDHVDPVLNSNSSFIVSGSMRIGISRNGTSPIPGRGHQSPEFLFRPGSSELGILFEGVYVESKDENGGERALCLLGNALLPSRAPPDSADPREWVKVQDDQILLVLRYPNSSTLTSRAVVGEMKSLNGHGSPRFFDKIQMSSQLGSDASYEFGSEELVSKACSPYPFHDDIVDGEFKVYRGTEFCRILHEFAVLEALNIVPNWNCNSTDDYCSEMGPFATEKEIKATHGGFANVGLLVQDLRCEPRIGENGVSLARVSAVFRVIHPMKDERIERRMTGLNGGLTLSAEGVWNSSAGQLCMVGCLGLGGGRCDSRICLYVPSSFAITRRSVIYGTIKSINGTHFPLSIEQTVEPHGLWRGMISNPFNTYKYSKVKLAAVFLERSEPLDFGTAIKKSLISYPRKGDDDDEMANLSQLADDLTLYMPYVPDPMPNVDIGRSFLKMEFLSIGPLFGRYWKGSEEFTNARRESLPPPPKADPAEKELLLNVSAQLELTGNLFPNVSKLYLEGLYNPIDGRMYLIGCRYARASWKILLQSRDLEGGLDCLIEVKVEYPPTSARWLMNPSAKFSITSRRNDDDPLHFSPVNLHTLPILYGQQEEYILSRRRAEGILQILTSSIAVLCISSQLFYVRDDDGVAPYISLVMLVVQATGYSIPLVTGAGDITSESYGFRFHEWEKNQWFQATDYMVKMLLLGALLLTLKIGQKVVKSRIGLLTRTPLEPRRVPSDRRVLLIAISIHLIGFAGVLVVHFLNASREDQDALLFLSRNSHQRRDWGILLEYAGLVQDFFLLPQIIGNLLWRSSCRPLRKTYYVGITLVRILPHVYDFVRAPDFNPFYTEVHEYVRASLGFYSKFGDIAITVIAAAFVTAIYVQQRWNYDKLSQALRSGQKGMLPSCSGIYERLPLISIQSELVSIVVGKEEA